MNDGLTDNPGTIGDDESGTTPPMTAVQMDERLMESTERMRADTRALKAVRDELHGVLLRKAALLEKLEAVWGEIRDERAATDAKIAQLLAATRALSPQSAPPMGDRVSA